MTKPINDYSPEVKMIFGITDEPTDPNEPRCKFARWTGRPWAGCAAKCVSVECYNPNRNNRKSGSPNWHDGAAYHFRWPWEYADDKANSPFVIVRSRFCMRAHCLGYEPLDENGVAFVPVDGVQYWAVDKKE